MHLSSRNLIERQLLELEVDTEVFTLGFLRAGELYLSVSEMVVALIFTLLVSSAVPRKLTFYGIPLLTVALLYILIVMDLTSSLRPPLKENETWIGHALKFLAFFVSTLLLNKA